MAQPWPHEEQGVEGWGTQVGGAGGQAGGAPGPPACHWPEGHAGRGPAAETKLDQDTDGLNEGHGDTQF